LDGTRLCGILYDPKLNARKHLVLAHGITSDKDEGDVFVKAASALVAQGYTVLRFDFRGHGESKGRSNDMTLTGEFLDLIASIRRVNNSDSKSQVGVLAASFGAGPTLMFASIYQTILSAIVLWNPVLDYEKTFLKPKSAWAGSYFNDAGYRSLRSKGYLMLDDFKIGKTLVEEMSSIRPFLLLKQASCPILTIHGDHDSKVPYEVSKEYATCSAGNDFVTLEGADHGFPTIKDLETAIEKSIEWFDRHLQG
jgi:pimeloyl-ACP methyl ester carboxylesterase